jgi:alkylation response protein AidB-like acyl-CoA dehydrogenase
VTRQALVPPIAEVPPEVEQLRVEVRTFLAGELSGGRFTPRCDAWLAGWDEEFSRALARRGWIGMTLPPEYGGHGRSTLERFAVTEELLAAGAPVAAHWIADRQMGPSLLRFGTDQQKQRFLPAIARGECFFGIGMSEPDAGSDLASVRMRASGGDGGWILDGTKVWTSGAHHAHALVVLARTEAVDPDNRHGGLSQFIVMTDSPGLTINPIRLLTGEHHFNEVVFDGVVVPDELVLGTIGNGWQQVTSELAFERSGPERILSTYPLLAHVVACVRLSGDGSHHPQMGALLARLWTLRQMSLAIASSLGGGVAADVPAALVKDLGTRFESEVIELARLVLDVEPDPTSTDPGARLLAQAELHAPGFTIRGGTNEILRGVVARAVGLR